MIAYTLLGVNEGDDLWVPDATPTAVEWSVADPDELGAWDRGRDPTALVIPEAGVYRVGAGYAFVTHDDDHRRQVFLAVDSRVGDRGELIADYPRGYLTDTRRGGYANGSSVSGTVWGPPVRFGAGQTLRLFASHNAGEPIRLKAAGCTWLALERWR